MSTTRRGHGQAKMNLVSTHTRLYQQGHVTAKGNAGHWLWALLWAPLQGLPPWLQHQKVSASESGTRVGSGIFYERNRGSFYEWDQGSLFDRDQPDLYEWDRGTIYEWDRHVFYERDWVSFMSRLG
jgi:hypothetical protein